MDYVRQHRISNQYAKNKNDLQYHDRYSENLIYQNE